VNNRLRLVQEASGWMDDIFSAPDPEFNEVPQPG
jgi:hypothetical protein